MPCFIHRLSDLCCEKPHAKASNVVNQKVFLPRSSFFTTQRSYKAHILECWNDIWNLIVSKHLLLSIINLLETRKQGIENFCFLISQTKAFIIINLIYFETLLDANIVYQCCSALDSWWLPWEPVVMLLWRWVAISLIWFQLIAMALGVQCMPPMAPNEPTFNSDPSCSDEQWRQWLLLLDSDTPATGSLLTAVVQCTHFEKKNKCLHSLSSKLFILSRFVLVL